MEFLLALLVFHLCKVSGLTLTVQTNYFEIGGSGFTMECNLDGSPWNPTSTRVWRVPPSTTQVITNGVANAGYSENISDAATAGIFRMTTPSTFSWDIENQLFQCVYGFSTASLNATHDTLARNSGGSASYDKSSQKCVFTISEILPSPTTVVTHVQSGSGELDISSDSRVQETLNNNSDQGQTFSYHIEVDGSNMKDGDQVKFQVTAGPFTEIKSCDIEKSDLSPCAIAGIVIAVVETFAAVVLAVLWRMKWLCFKEPSLRCGDKAGIVIAVLVGVVVIPAVVIVILWKKKKLCFKAPKEEKPTGSTNSGIRSTSPNQVKPSVENSTPIMESGNATDKAVDAPEKSDPIPDVENRMRHNEVEPLTKHSEGQHVINPNDPLPKIGQMSN